MKILEQGGVVVEGLEVVDAFKALIHEATEQNRRREAGGEPEAPIRDNLFELAQECLFARGPQGRRPAWGSAAILDSAALYRGLGHVEEIATTELSESLAESGLSSEVRRRRRSARARVARVSLMREQLAAALGIEV